MTPIIEFIGFVAVVDWIVKNPCKAILIVSFLVATFIGAYYAPQIAIMFPFIANTFPLIIFFVLIIVVIAIAITTIH